MSIERLINSPISLPAIVAGPLLRHCEPNQVTFWLVTTKPYRFGCQLIQAKQQLTLVDRPLTDQECMQTQVGEHAYINQLTVRLEQALPEDELIEYDLNLQLDDESLSVSKAMPELLYQGQTKPSFVIKLALENVLHGSCRKPHSRCKDGLTEVDLLLQQKAFEPEHRPSLLMLSGDQVYVDDVSGPMLTAIHQVIAKLGLFDEQWQNDTDTQDVITSSLQLFEHPDCYYRRHHFLPQDRVNKSVFDRIFAASKKPVFTSVNAKNHLVTLSEMIAMYFLTWSPVLWGYVDIKSVDFLTPPLKTIYDNELKAIEQFVSELVPIKRALAHIPTYMIFDDHDVTDDWNLTRGWEEAAYEHPFAKRIIGNALVGYYLCQGLGNGVDRLAELSEKVSDCFSDQGINNHELLIDEILAWDNWHYHLNTTPKMIVLDTRTHRWRSENNAMKPSGLMDWESLSELQQELINQPAVIMVSPAPIYGVKLIEAIQRVFTFFGKPLAVDAENWMAHSGTANVMLNIFKHHKTPPYFVILSGDVHYSFVYDVTHRFRRNRSQIIQVTCSGIKNKFPDGLLNVLERLNHYLYGRYSPLNWFTKRRSMKIIERYPDVSPNKSIYNGSGIGLLSLDRQAKEVKAELITNQGQHVVFEQRKEKS